MLPIGHSDVTPCNLERHNLKSVLGMVRHVRDFSLAEHAPRLCPRCDGAILHPVL